MYYNTLTYDAIYTNLKGKKKIICVMNGATY